MKRLMLVFLGLAVVECLCGCATTRSNQSVENRIQVLESKVQSLESGTASGQVASGGSEVVVGKSESGVTAETMTKKQIQQALKNAGYYDGNIDGKMGSKTKAAIKEFQKNIGLKADGVCGRNTKEKLAKYL